MDMPVAPLLDGYAQDRLTLPVCETCGTAHLYPRPRCPRCGGDRFDWRGASGRGEVTSFSVVHRAPSPEFADAVPYTVGLVRLAEGPQLMAWIVDTPPEAVRVGLPVALRFATLPGGERRPVFAPVEAEP
ncbi:MAG TPA: Zn-ribbon domain-containing OB-fold protein [Roseomonas sp.]|jgi:uncharacterized OB-fold protein